MHDEAIGKSSPFTRTRADTTSGAGSRDTRRPAAGTPAGDAQRSVSIIGADITIEGDIHASEDLVIEGTVHGSVTCGTLVVGESGRIHGDIRTERLRLAGMIEGSVVTHDFAVEEKARILGDIEYSRLRVTSGGIIEGSLTRRADAEAEGAVTKLASGSVSIPRRPGGMVFEDPSYREAEEVMRNASA